MAVLAHYWHRTEKDQPREQEARDLLAHRSARAKAVAQHHVGEDHHHHSGEDEHENSFERAECLIDDAGAVPDGAHALRLSRAKARAGAPSAFGISSGAAQSNVRDPASAEVLMRYSINVIPFFSRTSCVTCSSLGADFPSSRRRIG